MTTDVEWCLFHAAQLTLQAFANEFKFKSKADANLRYSQILASNSFKNCSHRKKLLREFQLWKQSTEEVAFWGKKAVENEKQSASYEIELDEIKTVKALSLYVGSSLRGSLRRSRSLGDL